MSTFTTPTPIHTDWTLLFKFHKTTIILPIAPSESLDTVRTSLFTALTSTPNLTAINGIPLPSSADEIQLAILNKASDTSSGWKRVDEIEHDADTDADAGALAKDSPKALGLKDGGMFAFRFGEACRMEEWPVRFPSFEDMDGEQRGRDGEVLQAEDEEDVPGLSDALKRTAAVR